MLEVFHRKGANLVPVFLASVPFIGLLVLSLAATASRLKPGSGVSVFFLSVVACCAALMSLSKVRPAPFLIYFSVVFAFLGNWALEAIWKAFSETAIAYDAAGYGGSGTWLLMVLFAIAALIAYMRQEAFDRDWSLSALPLWAREELQRFMKDSQSASLRALIAVALIVVAFVVIGFAMPHTSGEPASAGCRYGCAAAVVSLAVVAAGLFWSIVHIPDEERPAPEEAQD